MEFWDALLPRLSKKLLQRRTMGLDHGGVVYDPKDGKTYLKYYAGHAASSESRIDVDELQTGRSENDAGLKWFVYGFQIVLAVLTVVFLFVNEILRLALLNEGDAATFEWWVVGVVAAFLLILSASIWFNLRVHFNDMNTEWVESIKGIVGLNMTALIGKHTSDGFEVGAIAKCLLSFRRFIKWRRYMNFFEPLLIFAAFVQGVALIGLLQFDWVRLSSGEFVLLGLCVLLQVALYLRIHFLRWYWTKWRDPTLQLCLAFAEMDRHLWVCKHPGSGVRQPGVAEASVGGPAVTCEACSTPQSSANSSPTPH